MNRDILIHMSLSLFIYFTTPFAFSELVILDDTGLAKISGQLMIAPLLDDDIITVSQKTLPSSTAFAEPFDSSHIYEPLAAYELAQQQGQGISIIHTVFPTGARSTNTRVGNNGNLNFFGRDYRTGDNFDRVSDCFDTACGTGTDWDPDGDGIPGNSGGNPNFVPTGDDTDWANGGDGHIDDYYYEYDWYGEYGSNNVPNGGVPDSSANWHFYKIETDALIKVIATINRLSMGGYTPNYGGCQNSFEVVPDDGSKVLTNGGGCGTGISNYSAVPVGFEGQDDKEAYEEGYGKAQDEDRLLPKDDIASYFNYDNEMRNIQVGGVSCGGITHARASFLSGNAGYFGHCEADERTYNPVTLKNPYTEIALAPECELFADPACDQAGANTELVFAGYRSGFESVSGSLYMTQYVGTGSTSAVLPGFNDITCNPAGIGYGGDLGTNASVCDGYSNLLENFAQDGVLLFGHRARAMPALPGALCVTGGLLGINVTACPQLGTGGEGLQSNIAGQDIQGLWSSVVRNDFQWPGQGWAADDGNTTTPDAYRTTLADRDYAGVNTHIPPGVTAHGGTIINSYIPPAFLGIGAAYTHVEIGL